MQTTAAMRRCWMGLLGAASLAMSLTGCAVFAEPEAGGEGQDKVLVCHKGKKTLSVAEPARAAHLRHGDTPGPCR
jgi:hypothetical protein